MGQIRDGDPDSGIGGEICDRAVKSLAGGGLLFVNEPGGGVGAMGKTMRVERK